MKYRFCFVLCLSIAAAAQTVGFKLHNDYLILTKCSIADRHDLVALIDSGATETAIDTKLATRLHLQSAADTATLGTRTLRVSAVAIPDLAIGPFRVENVAGIAVDGSVVERQLGVRADVIVGMDVLERSSFVIDYKARTIAFGSSPHFAHTASLVRGHHLALVPALIGKASLLLQLDTGLNGILIYGGRVPVSEHILNARSSTPIAGISVQAASMPLHIGNWEERQATVVVTDDNPPGETPFDGLLGPTAMGAHRLALDWKFGTISWE